MSDSESTGDSGDSTAGNSPAVSSSETISYTTDGNAAKPPHSSGNSGLSLSDGLGGVKEAASAVGTALTLKGIASAANPLVAAGVLGYGLYSMVKNSDGGYTPATNPSGNSLTKSQVSTTSGFLPTAKISIPVSKEVTAPAVSAVTENAGEIKPQSGAQYSSTTQTDTPINQSAKTDYSFILPIIGLLAFGGFYGT